MSEQKSKQKTVFQINPPPKDRRCEVCGKHVKDVKPFGGKGDPLVGDFTGAKLIKTFRPMSYLDEKERPSIELLDSIYKEEMDGKLTFDECNKKLKENFSEKELERLNFLNQLINTIEASWECRDCVVMDDNKEYFEKKRSEK